ncbi:MAG TPA: DUF58 domain-containing protein [Planctomycetota bacterium]|nr:DUF58 domain-containing protein [Planctomycetota bacterium]
MPEQQETTFRYLDFDTLSRISDMQLLAKTVVEGFVLGLHRSPYRGFSVEFAEYRQYVPGDEIRHLDWKVYGKTDRFYIKQFEEETNLACTVVLDKSASMGYGSGRLTKLEYGSYLAASLAYFMMMQRDATGLVLFDTEIRTLLPPRSRMPHLHLMLAELEGLKPGGATETGKPLHDLAEGIKKRGLIILISDLYDEPDAVLSGLQHFKFLGNDVIVFHVMDKAELEFPFDRMTEFVDPETNERLLTAPDAVRKQYLAELNRFLDAYREGCAELKVDYRLFDTSTPLELALSEYLFQRSRRF